jgi:hypothetical protein
MGLIDHAKAPPGQRGWQSAMCATPELVSLIGTALESGLVLRKPPEPIILRDADGKSIDYRETRETTRMRREIEAQNEAIAGAQFGGATSSSLSPRCIASSTEGFFPRAGAFMPTVARGSNSRRPSD